jgi:hypothetical protein
MTTRSKNSDFESNQENSLTHSTPTKGGAMPGKDDVIESANARSKRRHETGSSNYADLDTLKQTAMTTLDMSGIKDSGYLVKKGTPFGVEAFFNSLPPGTDITDQEVADIRKQELLTYSGGISFPGDGWT